MFKYIYLTKTYLASSANAMTPAAMGVAADVPENWLVQPLLASVVHYVNNNTFLVLFSCTVVIRNLCAHEHISCNVVSAINTYHSRN